jgi:hypothetical protein
MKGGWPTADKYIIFFGFYKESIKLLNESLFMFSYVPLSPGLADLVIEVSNKVPTVCTIASA